MKVKKMWNVTYTEDKVNFKTESVEWTSYTDAYVNTMLKHPQAMITELGEC